MILIKMWDYQGIKLIMFGESYVGKTNLIYISVGFICDVILIRSYYEKSIATQNKRYIFHLLDAPGSEIKRPLFKLLHKNAKIVIIVFAINNRASFKEVDFLYNYTKRNFRR